MPNDIIDINMNAIKIATDSGDDLDQTDFSIRSDTDSLVRVYFKEMRESLIQHIQGAEAVVGCVAWVTDLDILSALGSKPGALIIQKEITKFAEEKVCVPSIILTEGWEVTSCPEAMGINVSDTMKWIGVVLQWPPREVAIQVALAARRKK
jgi:hypothetical protein